MPDRTKLRPKNPPPRPNPVKRPDEAKTPKKASADLNAKQQLFVQEYLVDLNGKQAAIRAGYSAKTAEVQASKLLSLPKVAAEVARRQENRAIKLDATSDRIITELLCMGMYDAGDFSDYEINSPADIKKLPESLRRAIIGWSWDRNNNFTLKLAAKTPNLQLVGQHLGMFKKDVDPNDLAEGFAALLAASRQRARQAPAPSAVH